MVIYTHLVLFIIFKHAKELRYFAVKIFYAEIIMVSGHNKLSLKII